MMKFSGARAGWNICMFDKMLILISSLESNVTSANSSWS